MVVDRFTLLPLCTYVNSPKYWVRGWENVRADLDANSKVKILLGDGSNPDCPSRSHSLWWLKWATNKQVAVWKYNIFRATLSKIDLWLDSSIGPRPPLWGSPITLGHTTIGRNPLDQCSARRRDLYLDNTQHSQETDIHATGGIRTYNSSKRTAAEPRLRPRGHWDRWNDTDTCPSFTLSTNLTWTGPGSNLGLRGERLATNHPSKTKISLRFM